MFESKKVTNIQLSSRTDEWYTPQYIVEMVREVLGEIDLDPASSLIANEKIRAKKIFTKENDGLQRVWSTMPVKIYLNSPGGKLGIRSYTALFWQKLLDQRNAGLLEDAIFMGFSLEHLAVTQSCTESICDFPLVIPRRRIKFVSPSGDFNSPTHSNVIAYVPGLTNNTRLFKDVFGSLGKIMHPG